MINEDFVLKTYNDYFFYDSRTRLRYQSIEAARILFEYFNDIESVIDLGCGVCSFIEGMLLNKNIKEVKGIEIAYENAKKYISKNVLEYVEQGDVSLPIKDEYANKYDCAFSIEVAEHILPENSDIFVDNLCKCAKKLIILTTARPDQGGVEHINCREKSFWIEKIENRGWILAKQDLENVIALLDKNEWIEWYMKDNLSIYKKST